ncbi:MAG: metal ABC transporter ATP-binding protein [Deltaproteobacteria bacterium]|nr:metal ABC transporter ATP-binding protein [Candidatus Zymogenaceae bacterium]
MPIKETAVLDVKNLAFSYNHWPVIEDITFSLVLGDYLWVIGPNGSGKTTLVKNILGILSPKSGTIRLFGKDLRAFDRWNRIAYVPQKIAFFDPYFPASVREVCAMGLLSERDRLSRFGADDDTRVDEALDRVGIRKIRDRRIGELSGGQLQRVLLAKALITNPQLLFLDEPTAAVEPSVREDFFAIVDDLNARGTAIVLINHDIAGMHIHNNKILYINRRQVFFGEGKQFCLAQDMSDYFGSYQHVICHQHTDDEHDTGGN